MAASVISSEWQEWVDQLARADARPQGIRSDPDRFACWLEKQPGLLVPRRFLRSSAADEDESSLASASGEVREVVWSPRCIVCAPGEIPAELAHVEEWRAGFAFHDHSTAWIFDPEREQWRPFCMGEELAARVIKAQESHQPAKMFDPAEREALLRAGILTTEASEAVARKQWADATLQNRERFQQRGYCALGGLLHPFHVGELRRYYRRLIRHGRVPLGDYQSERRYVAHNEPVERFFHFQMTGTVSRLVGEPVMPSYVYLASYLGGASLPLHTDREQCEFSVTFCLDYAPEPAGPTPWPLYLDVQGVRVAVYLALGDALLYRGCEFPHYREPLPDGHVSTSIFFHYVRADFAGSLS